MKIHHKICYTAALIFGMLATLSSCNEPINNQTSTETYSNTFMYEGEDYTIGSVVRFDQDNNTIQFWISSEEGLTTVDQIESKGNYLVLSSHKSYLGTRDRFTKAGSFVSFGNKKFAYGDNGLAYIEAAINGEELTLDFAAESMFTKADQTTAIIKGDYKGGYCSYTEEPLSNQWAVDRTRGSISKGNILVREDGGADTFTLYDASGDVVVEFKLPQARRGLTTLFTTNGAPFADACINKADGSAMDLTKAFGTITASTEDKTMKVSYDITYEGVRTRAVYEGSYSSEFVKGNRYIYDSGYTYGSGYDGVFYFDGLRVEEKINGIVFKFIPKGTDEMYSDIPELTIYDMDLIGKENIDMRNTPGWHFEFDKINVDYYENEWKPAPLEGSKLTILRTENGYIFDMELATVEPTFSYISSIDLHYEGPVNM